MTVLARNPAAVAPRDYRPRVLEGNALDPEAVEAAVEGQDAVLSALGTRSRKPTTLFSASTANLVAAMKKHGVRRLVCLTGIGAGDSKGARRFPLRRVILPFVVNNQYEDKDRQEIVRRSGLDWVIVRPARLTNGSATGEYRGLSPGGILTEPQLYPGGGRRGFHARSTERGSLPASDACDQLLRKTHCNGSRDGGACSAGTLQGERRGVRSLPGFRHRNSGSRSTFCPEAIMGTSTVYPRS